MLASLKARRAALPARADGTLGYFDPLLLQQDRWLEFLLLRQMQKGLGRKVQVLAQGKDARPDQWLSVSHGASRANCAQAEIKAGEGAWHNAFCDAERHHDEFLDRLRGRHDEKAVKRFRVVGVDRPPHGRGQQPGPSEEKHQSSRRELRRSRSESGDLLVGDAEGRAQPQKLHARRLFEAHVEALDGRVRRRGEPGHEQASSTALPSSSNREASCFLWFSCKAHSSSGTVPIFVSVKMGLSPLPSSPTRAMAAA